MMKRKLILLACATGLLASPGLADETGKAAFDSWLRSNADIGLEMTYQSAEESGDVLTVSGLDVSYSIILEPTGAPSPDDDMATLSLSVTAPLVKAATFASDAEGFSVQHLVLSDDTRFAIEVASSGRAEYRVEGVIEGYELRNAAWPDLPDIAKDPLRPVSRWMPLLESFRDWRIEEYRINRLEMTEWVTDPQGNIRPAKYEIQDTMLRDLRDGKIGEYSTGRSTQTVSFTGTGGQPLDLAVGIASTRVRDYDVAGLLALFQPETASMPDRSTMIGSIVMLGYNVRSDIFDWNIDRIAIEDVRVRRPQVNLLRVLDAALSGTESDAADIAAGLFEMFRSLAVGRFSVDGIRLSFWDFESASSIFSIELGQLLVSNLNSEGLRELSLSSLKANTADGHDVRAGKLSIEDIEFAPYRAIEAFIRSNPDGVSEPFSLEIARAFAPLSISASMRDFAGTGPDITGITVDEYFLGFETAVPPVPTDIEISLEGYEIPVSALNGSDAKALFAAAGIDRLHLSQSVLIHWDEQSEDVFIDNIELELEKIGRIRASAQLGGVPRAILENPDRFEAILATLNIKAIELELTNEGGVETALHVAAARQGMSENQIIDVLLVELAGALRMIGNEAFASKVLGAAERFIADPKTLRVSAYPPTPVPVLQIIANVEIAPGSIPDILDLQIEANR